MFGDLIVIISSIIIPPMFHFLTVIIDFCKAKWEEPKKNCLLSEDWIVPISFSAAATATAAPTPKTTPAEMRLDRRAVFDRKKGVEQKPESA